MNIDKEQKKQALIKKRLQHILKLVISLRNDPEIDYKDDAALAEAQRELEHVIDNNHQYD